jgi:4-hydroxy 2-oxovalerate aldolase
MTLNILDCTLRDGGYYNNWDFPQALITDYLNAMSSLNVAYVELGLRQFKNDCYLGAHAYTTAEYLNRINLPDGPVYGVMVDAKTIISEDFSQEEGIDKLFADQKVERISLVRVAAHFSEVERCLPMLDRLKQKGYLVGLNIMQSSLRDSDELAELSALVSTWRSVDVLYFADSLGSMNREDMVRVYTAIRENWKKDIGFHSHNNMGRAVANVSVAIDLGCSWIDSTVTGMGRGAGNAETEYVLLEPRIRDADVDLSGIYNLIQKHFFEMKQRCGWGVSVPYYIGAINKLHPTYIQKLCANSALDQALIPKVISDLGRVPEPSFFDPSVLNGVLSKTNANVDEELTSGSEIPDFLVGREVVLVAQTDQTLKYKEAIKDYVNKKKPMLISINLPRKELDLEYDLVVASHNEKFREDETKYGFGHYRFVAPKSMFKGLDIDIAFDYGIRITRESFDTCGTYACLPFRLSLAYALAFCLEAGASNINLVGFGGFELSDPRQKEMQDFLKILSRKSLQLHSLTPTSFTIPERSIYAL